ncbi:MAG: hypothetical protein D3924_12735, partial [Candidatus Electrothrix sp. AR4]|nr:hypothetical protein [Candidatus Electrothrix sp. AR4]
MEIHFVIFNNFYSGEIFGLVMTNNIISFSTNCMRADSAVWRTDRNGIFWSRLIFFLFPLLLLLPISFAKAANPDLTEGALRIEIVSSYNLVVDSNVTSPPTYAPKAATLGARICNDGTKPIHDVHAYIGDYVDGTNDTPGTYPVFDSAGDSRTYLADTGIYSLTHESGSFSSATDASRAWVGTIEPGECKVEYWIISYPQCVNVSGNPQAPPCDATITGGV